MSISYPKTTEQEHLLSQEAAMASMSIGLGLTNLRRYNFNQSGSFYSSLYLITTGLERLLKIIIIYDHRINNGGKFPNNSQLKNFGHNIGELFAQSVSINKERGFSNEQTIFDNDAIYSSILSILSDFAKQARYYNLDCLSGKKQNTEEPLRRWNDEINSTLINRHYKENPKRIAIIKHLSELMEGSSAVMHTYEDGSDINTVADLYLLGDLISTKQRYSVYYIYAIVRFLSNLCRGLEYRGNFYPMLHEYFMIFRNDDKQYILRKKSWNPNPPYHF